MKTRLLLKLHQISKEHCFRIGGKWYNLGMTKVTMGLAFAVVLLALLLLLLLGYISFVPVLNTVRTDATRQPLVSPGVNETNNTVSPTASGAVDSLSVNEYGQVIVPDNMNKCEVDDDCVWEYGDCGDCKVAAINKQHKVSYEQQKIDACQSYYETTEKPQVQCDMVFYGDVRCLGGRCAAVAPQ